MIMTFVCDGETQAEENIAITTLCLGSHSAAGPLPAHLSPEVAMAT